MERVFVDTSAWFAYVNRPDPDHKPVREAIRAHDGRLVTSSYVFDEVVTLCRYRLDHRSAVRAGNVLREPDSVDLIRITGEDEQAAWELFETRRDQEYSFTDCTSFVLMRRLGITVAIAADDDFEHEGFHVLPKR
jgi:predicted nucleic acid-binding protein